jgi:hypothetical protein
MACTFKQQYLKGDDRMNKHLTTAAALLLAAAVLTGCTSPKTSGSTVLSGAIAETSAAPAMDSTTMFTGRDLETGYEASQSAAIILKDGGSSSPSPDVTISGDTVTITGEGVFVLSGTLTNGQILIACPADQKVQLVLNGASVTNAGSAALYVSQADKVFITTAAGTENLLAETGAYRAIDEQNIDAAVYSRCDLTLSGMGTLTVSAQYGHGIVSKDDLIAASGTYIITSALCALSGNNSVRIADGVYTLTSGSDGIRGNNGDKAEQGYIYIADGSFIITAGTDGLNAQAALKIDGGSFTINAADDAVNAGTNVIINGGSFTVLAGDDAVHADADVLISGGTLDIKKSYEGIEGVNIAISGGDISVVSSDDGLNAVSATAGGQDSRNIFQNDPDCGIILSGGSLTVNASGDGIDSNGALTISGGNITVNGPTANNNGALDAGTAVITGGTLIAAGSSGMAVGFGAGSTQGSILYTLANGQPAGTNVSLLNASGMVIAEITPAKDFQALNISTPDLLTGGSYTLRVGSAEYAIAMDTLAYSNGGAGGFGPGAGNFGPGMNNPGNRHRP